MIRFQQIVRMFGNKAESASRRRGRPLTHDSVTACELRLLMSNVDARELSDQSSAAVVDAGEENLTSPLLIKIGGASLTTFNALTAPLYFQMSKGTISAFPEDVLLQRNGTTIPSNRLTVTPTRIDVSQALVEGKNEFQLKVYDQFGVPVFYRATVWAGSREITVNVVKEDGSPLTGKATITARLGDDQSVFVTKSSKGGIVKFTNVPDRTIFLQGKAGALIGFKGVTGAVGTTQLTLRSFRSPNVSSPAQASALESAPAPASGTATLIYGETLFTTNEGETSRVKSFNTAPGVSTVRIRYRFNTSEVPGGFFGSKYNDYFRVMLRSPSGGQIFEANSMNGLGLAAFTSSGSTAWREKTLKVNPKGDVIEFDGAVANVGDGAYDSSLEVSIESLTSDISYTLQWDSTNGGMKINWLAKSDIASDTPVYVFFANGQGWSNRIGASVFSFTIPGGTKAKAKGLVQVPGSTLDDSPIGTTHVLVASGDSDAQAIQDVSLGFSSTADSSVVNAATLRKIKNAMRFAGQSSATITSTIRRPEEQAHAMFRNLVNPQHTIEQNIASQRALYAAAGDQVIDVFETAVAGLTNAQVLANALTIRQSMTDKINQLAGLGQRVSKHCVTPTQYNLHNIVDIGRGAFGTSARTRFLQSISEQGASTIDEPDNGALHLEF